MTPSECGVVLRRAAVIFQGTIQVTTSNLLRPGNLILDLVDAQETLAGQALRSSTGTLQSSLHALRHPMLACAAPLPHASGF